MRKAPATPAATHAARDRDSTSAAAAMATPAAPSPSRVRERASSVTKRSSGRPMATRWAMKFRLPKVPPGARVRLARLVFTSPYAGDQRGSETRPGHRPRAPEQGGAGQGHTERADGEPPVARGQSRDRRYQQEQADQRVDREQREPACGGEADERRGERRDLDDQL